MTQELEDRLRAAFRGKADQIPPVAPPLELTQPRQAARPGGTGGRGSWLTPGQRRLAAGLAAAAAVAAIAVGTVVASGPSTPPAQFTPPAPSRPAKKLPPYYVAITSATKANSGWTASVRATRTGAVIARIPVPRPYTDFTGVTGSADGRTFVLQAVSFAHPSVPDKFFQLRINPGAGLAAGRARLTPLSVQLPQGTRAIGMALSPDSESLALVAEPAPGDRTANRIIIYNLSTGASHSWETHGCTDNCTIGGNPGASGDRNTISWTADGRQLGFDLVTGALGNSQFRLLNVGAAGDDVLADSQPVTLRAAPGVLNGVAPRDTSWGIALVTPDGRSVIINAANFPRASAQHGPSRALFSQDLLRYSVRTGALQTVLGIRPSHPGSLTEHMLWTSPDGSTILVTGFKDAHSAGLLHDRHYTSIPWSPLTVDAAW